MLSFIQGSQFRFPYPIHVMTKDNNKLNKFNLNSIQIIIESTHPTYLVILVNKIYHKSIYIKFSYFLYSTKGTLKID